MKGHQALRKGRCSISGQVYLVTATTHCRKPFFFDWAAASEVARVISSPSVCGGSSFLAWVLMPDHFHILVELGETDKLPALMSRLRGACTRRLTSAGLVRGPLWAKAFHDRAIRREEDLLPAARYIIANPMRAGISRGVSDYPFWNAVWV